MNTLRIEIAHLPENSRTWDELYITGEFCGWYPDLKKFHKKRNGTFWIEINSDTDTIEFKITRGSWKSAECKANGHQSPNRIHKFENEHETIQLEIENWEDRRHTVTNNVILWKEKMTMKPMTRKRNIWVYLPPDYEKSEKKYPVMYIHDGQNIFDEYSSFSGEWGVDKTLNNHFRNTEKGYIVVAIENDGKYRSNEYVPWEDGNNADKYLKFITETLKPLVDKEFRTMPEQENTAIGGSSYGALISLYAGIKYQEIFSKILAFSPVFCDFDKFIEFLEKEGYRKKMRIYFLAGKFEGEAMAIDIKEIIRHLYWLGIEKENLQMLVHPHGVHAEWFWQQEFGTAFRWLFK